MTTIPAGWHDDGQTLIAPNGIKIANSFRDYILEHGWAENNLPLGPETDRSPVNPASPALGAGTYQVFRTTLLRRYAATGEIEAVGISQAYLDTIRQLDNMQAQISRLKHQAALAPQLTQSDNSSIVSQLQQQSTPLQLELQQTSRAVSIIVDQVRQQVEKLEQKAQQQDASATDLRDQMKALREELEKYNAAPQPVTTFSGWAAIIYGVLGIIVGGLVGLWEYVNNYPTTVTIPVGAGIAVAAAFLGLAIYHLTSSHVHPTHK